MKRMCVLLAMVVTAALSARAAALTGHVVVQGTGARSIALAATGAGETVLAWRGAGGVRASVARKGPRFAAPSLIGPLDDVVLAGSQDSVALVGARGRSVEVASRPAGGIFGPVAAVAADVSPIRDLAAASDADGDVLIAYGTATGRAVLIAGGRLGRTIEAGDGPAAIGGDGAGDFGVAGCHGASWTFFYRPAGGYFAARPALHSPSADCSQDGETGGVAVGPGGAATLVWSAGIYDPGVAGLNVVARAAGGDGTSDRTRFFANGVLWAAGSGGFAWVSGRRLRYTALVPGGAIGRAQTLAGDGSFGEIALTQDPAGDTYVAWTRRGAIVGALQRAGSLRLGAAHTLARFTNAPEGWTPELAVALDGGLGATLAFTTPRRRLVLARFGATKPIRRPVRAPR